MLVGPHACQVVPHFCLAPPNLVTAFYDVPADGPGDPQEGVYGHYDRTSGRLHIDEETCLTLPHAPAHPRCASCPCLAACGNVSGVKGRMPDNENVLDSVCNARRGVLREMLSRLVPRRNTQTTETIHERREIKQADQTNSPAPDHTVQNKAPIPPPDQKPEVYAVTDLRALGQAGLAEELSQSTGAWPPAAPNLYAPACPVETCACNTVSHAVGSEPGCSCACTGDCGGYIITLLVPLLRGLKSNQSTIMKRMTPWWSLAFVLPSQPAATPPPDGLKLQPRLIKETGPISCPITGWLRQISRPR